MADSTKTSECLNCGHSLVCHEQVQTGFFRNRPRIRCNAMVTLRAKWADHDRLERCQCDSNILAVGALDG